MMNQDELTRTLLSLTASPAGFDVLFEHSDAVSMESMQFFNDFLVNVNPRRPMWQMMLGGVFDRHPDLKLVLTEIRLDWIPATLLHLDEIYEEHRAELPAKKKPSEYWSTSCLAGASFIHKAEVEKWWPIIKAAGIKAE